MTFDQHTRKITVIRKTTQDLRPMSEAPMTGPVVEVLVATTARAGNKGWLVAHYADGGGEDQPRFKGWFYWTGFGFDQVPDNTLIGWLPLPDLYKDQA